MFSFLRIFMFSFSKILFSFSKILLKILINIINLEIPAGGSANIPTGMVAINGFINEVMK